MGTCGILGFQIDKITKGTYVHFDAYPSGLGHDITNFLVNLNQEKIERLKQRIQAATWVSSEDEATEEDRKKYASFSRSFSKFCLPLAEPFGPTEWYELLRGIQGATTLVHLLDGSLSHLIDDTAFLEGSLSCEWAYIINFDDQVLDVYKGIVSVPFPFQRIKQVNLLEIRYDVEWLNMVQFDIITFLEEKGDDADWTRLARSLINWLCRKFL